MAIDNEASERKLNELLADRTDQVVDIALATRKAVRSAAKKLGHECSELVYCSYCVSNALSFTHKLGQSFIHIATYANHVNLGFNQGATLDDPNGLLKGNGKAIRHIRIESLKDLKSKSVKELIAGAVSQGLEMAEKKDGVEEAQFFLK